MIRKINNKNITTEQITNEPFDDVIGHSDNIRKYFTIKNNDIIYNRLKMETDINSLPYLGPCVDFGLGDACIEESVIDGNEVFKFYVIDRTCKFNYQEFSNIEDAIECLVKYYVKYEMISDSEKMKSIFMETLKLSKNKNLSLINKK